VKWIRPRVPASVSRAFVPGTRVEVLRPLRASGALVVETRRIVLLDIGGKIIKVPKEGALFVIGGSRAVPGSALVGSPAERLVRSA